MRSFRLITQSLSHRTHAVFILSLLSDKQLGDAISANCNEFGWDIKVDMDILRCIYPDIKASDIYLGKNLCNGEEERATLTFTQGLRECLTSEIVGDTFVIEF